MLHFFAFGLTIQRIMSRKKKITVIGLGPMGRAMAEAYLNKGYEVTVWNRTESKSDEIAAKGAVKAANISEAVRTNPLLIISLTGYETMYFVLSEVQEELRGRTVVNMSSDTPEQVRKAEQWANNLGAEFLSGGIMVPPPLVGQADPNVYTFYSGKRSVFESHHEDLEVMTATDFRGEDIGLAMLYYQASLNILFTSLTGIIQSYAMIVSAGLPAKDFEPYMENFMTFLPSLVKDANIANEIDSKKYSSAQQRLLMMAAGATHVAHTARDAGVNHSLPDVVEKIFLQTMERGYGNQGTNSIIETLKNT
jgi:3-hydroxyisobutyrate dehydrogenase-like beta-hydroxyacid dehydrogenase